MAPLKILVAFLCLPATLVFGDEPQVVPLWANGAPGFESRRDEPEVAKDYWVKNIHNPSITVFLPPKEKATGAAVVICPGGGHRELVYNAEGVAAAHYLNSIGVAAFALKYRLGREQGSPYSIEKHAREDGVRHEAGARRCPRMERRSGPCRHHGLLRGGRGRLDGGFRRRRGRRESGGPGRSPQ